MVVFTLQFLILQTSTIKIYFIFITKMSSGLVFFRLFIECGCSVGLSINAIVIFTLIEDLDSDGDTLFMLLIYSCSMREALRWAFAVLRSLVNFSLPW